MGIMVVRCGNNGCDQHRTSEWTECKGLRGRSVQRVASSGRIELELALALALALCECAAHWEQ
jgi:hypothetical protein